MIFGVSLAPGNDATGFVAVVVVVVVVVVVQVVVSGPDDRVSTKRTHTRTKKRSIDLSCVNRIFPHI